MSLLVPTLSRVTLRQSLTTVALTLLAAGTSTAIVVSSAPRASPSAWRARTGSAGMRAPGTAGSAMLPESPRGERLDRWSWPLSPRPRVVRPFVRPQGRYGPGHRGVDLAGRSGAMVRAVDAGTVAHVGVVAGRGTVTILHPSGLRSTYEPVTATVRQGQPVARRAPLGHLDVEGSHCLPQACLHLGAIRGTEYVDPLLLLAEGGRVRLLPLRGSATDGSVWSGHAWSDRWRGGPG